MKCLICQRETSRSDTMIIAFGYGMKVCVSCDDWILTLEREPFISDEEKIYIMDAVFEYVQCANDKYIECHHRHAMESERTLHYKDIINMGHSILIKLSSEDIEIEYNMAMYIDRVRRSLKALGH